MGKNIWIFNHYATGMFTNESGRHFMFAKNLIELGHHPTIFCASTIHNSDKEIEMGKELYKTNQEKGIDFVFIKTPPYEGNGKARIKNMIAYYRGLFPVAKEYSKVFGKPDVILASSPHPLALISAIKLAKKFNIPSICEVRDLWPESLVDYGYLKETSLLAKVLYRGEKWIYEKADKLIFTMEGGKDYILDKDWNSVNLNKVYYINNGIDLERFNYNKEHHTIEDPDLENNDTFKVIYTGSIRLANNIERLVEIAKIIDQKGYQDIKLLVYGDGPDRSKLKNYCEDNEITNIKFKGWIENKYIPYILSKSNLNIMHLTSTRIKKYGASLIKMSEYFASGKPTISDCEFGYDIIKKFNCGIVIDNANAEQMADAIIEIFEMDWVEYGKKCDNALKAAQDFDFKVLTKKLEQIL